MIVTEKENFKLPNIENKNWYDRKLFNSAKNSPYFCSPTNNSASKIISRNRNNRMPIFNQLPVIEEEEGVCSEDLNVKNYFFSNSELKDPYLKRKTFNIIINNKLSKKLIKRNDSIEFINIDSKLSSELPSLLNINCMMNTDIKQSQPIWDTSFGKRLINGKNYKEKLDISTIESFPLIDDDFGEKSGDWRTTKPNESSLFNKNAIPDCALTVLECGEHDSGIDVELSKKEVEETNRKIRNLKKQDNTPNKSCSVRKNSGMIDMSRKMFNKVVKKEDNHDLLQEPENFPRVLNSQKPFSTTKRNRNFLTECIKSILEKSSDDKLICEFCKSSFLNFKELLHHKKTHEQGKQSCLICKKVIYKSEDFIRHLITHEKVDKFSCKICKMYFPSLGKCTKHYREFHLMENEMSAIYPEIQEREPLIKCLNKYKSNYKCTLCKKEFDSQEQHRAHKKFHLKTNWTPTNILCPENVNTQL